jgi:predicted acylesterase/phospholipase RssA
MTDAIGDKAVLSSRAVPGFFPPVEVEGEFYVDGGVVRNTLVIPTVDARADIIHRIYLDPERKA